MFEKHLTQLQYILDSVKHQQYSNFCSYRELYYKNIENALNIFYESLKRQIEFISKKNGYNLEIFTRLILDFKIPNK